MSHSHESGDSMTDVLALMEPLRRAGILSDQQIQKTCSDIAHLLDTCRGEGMSADALSDEEAYWGGFQQEFDFVRTRPLVRPMNAANLCPEPKALLDASNLLRLEYNRNVAQQMRMSGGERVIQLDACRALLADALKLRHPTDLAIVRNASEGNNAVSGGYRRWHRTTKSEERENVVLWKQNHPTNLESWKLRAQWESIENPLFDVIEVDFPRLAPFEEITKAFTDRIGPRTRFVAFSATANSNGARIPDQVVQGIWDHVQQRGYDCHVHIDGTMEFGARAVDLSRLPCHSFVSSAHKWFLGPKETGILYMSPDRVERFSPNIFAYDYQIRIGKWQDMPKDALRFELLGQRDDVNILSMALTQLMWNGLIAGPYDPFKRVLDLADTLRDLLARTAPNRWEVVTPPTSERSLGVIRIKAPRGDRAENLYTWLYKNRGIAGSGDNETFRLCPHIYNTKKDIQDAVEGMNAWYEGRP